MSEGAQQYANDAYRGDIMARTKAQMDANTRLEQAKAAVLGPDGQLDEAKFRQYAVIDPQGAKALRDAIAPRMEYDIQNIDGQLYYVPKDPQVAPPQSAPMQQPQAPAPSVLNAAVEQQESGGNPFAVSPAGARGPMQTMPGTLRDPGYGVAPAKDGSVDEQRRVGQDYLAALTAKYGLDGGLAAYNWGPGNWEKALAANGGNVQSALMSAPKETRDYVPSVKRRLGQIGSMTASMGDTPVAPAGAFPVPGVPRAAPKSQAAPSGYRFRPDGGLEMIPGGPAEVAAQARSDAQAARKAADDAKALQAEQTANARQDQAAESAQSLISAIDTLEAHPGFKTLGTVHGDFNLSVPYIRNATKDADAQLKNISGQVALATMNTLKALSKQGATGFGALSEKELSLLENSIATLKSENISNQQLKDSLQVIKDKMEKVARWKQMQASAPSSGGLSPAEQQELEDLRKRLGR